MATIRYGAKPEAERRNRELEATSEPIWSESLEAIWETDPEIVAAVLPKPLLPGPEPLVRLNTTTVTMPGGYVFGAGWFGVQARHGDVLGEYPLFMPMTTEQATIGGRETFGEPKKIADISVTRNGDDVASKVGRVGFTIAEIVGTITEEREPTERDRVDFYFKPSPSPSDKGALDCDPFIVHSHKHLTERKAEGVAGEVILHESPLDPLIDIEVRRVVDIAYTERTTTVDARVVGTVPAGNLLPFMHQRYDDLSVLGKKD